MRGMSVLITSGRFTELFHKGAVEPGVVAKAAGEIGFRDRRPCADRIGTAVQPLLRNVLMGRQTDQVLEEMHNIIFAQIEDLAEMLQGQCFREML